MSRTQIMLLIPWLALVAPGARASAQARLKGRDRSVAGRTGA